MLMAFRPKHANRRICKSCLLVFYKAAGPDASTPLCVAQASLLNIICSLLRLRGRRLVKTRCCIHTVNDFPLAWCHILSGRMQQRDICVLNHEHLMCLLFFATGQHNGQQGIVPNLTVDVVTGHVVTDVEGAIGHIATAPPGTARGTAADLKERNAHTRTPSLRGPARRLEQEAFAEASAPPATDTNTRPEHHPLTPDDHITDPYAEQPNEHKLRLQYHIINDNMGKLHEHALAIKPWKAM